MVPHETTETFGELIAGYQPSDDTQVVVWGTALDRDSDIPGSVTPISLGDTDDTRDFRGYDAVLAVRQRLSSEATVTGKYSYRRAAIDSRNPDALTGGDTNPFRRLKHTSDTHSGEVRLDVDSSNDVSLRAGFSFAGQERTGTGTVGAVDPGTGAVVFSPFRSDASPGTVTMWGEVEKRFNDQVDGTIGAYWGREGGRSKVVLPKAVVTYRPNDRTWIAAMAIPIFRDDVAELSPVEALSDPAGLGYLDFAEGGAGRSYELRAQRQTGNSGNVTASVAYQRVKGLLIDVDDPADAALPERILASRGHRWVADASYERWFCNRVTGRTWVRWQDTQATFPSAGVTGTEWPYAPEWQAGGRLDYIDDNGLRIGLEGIWSDSRFDDAANTLTVASPFLVNLRAQYQRNLHEKYFIDVRNLTDRNYVSHAGYPQADLTVTGGVQYRF